TIEPSHRPEKKTRLIPVTPEVLRARGLARAKGGQSTPPLPTVDSISTSAKAVEIAPTRLLPRPISFGGSLRPGTTVSVDHRLYSVERVTFEQRLTDVEWWSGEHISRDYLRVWLSGGSTGLELIVFVDRVTGSKKIQAVCD